MQEHLKNPYLYIILVPAVLAIVAGYLYLTALPAAQAQWDTEERQYLESQTIVADILALDPGRLKYDTQGSGSGDFDYANVINDFARRHGISPSSYHINSRKPVVRQGKKSKRADLTIDAIKIEKFASFLSQLQAAWPDLVCEQISLTKLKTEKDSWDATVKLNYHY